MKQYSKDLYSREAILKCAYAFTDECYIHLDAQENLYLVTLKSRNGIPEDTLYDRFENELIAQETRRVVAEKTKNIREMIVARSLSSTIVDSVLETDDENDLDPGPVLQTA